MAAEPMEVGRTLADPNKKVLLRFFGSIRAAAGKSNDELSIPSDTTVYGLIITVSDIYGVKMRDELLDEKSPDGLRDDLMITVNDAIINHEKGAGTRINQGDNVALYPMFPGGG